MWLTYEQQIPVMSVNYLTLDAGGTGNRYETD